MVRVARNAPIVRVAHGWGVGLRHKKITLFFWLTANLLTVLKVRVAHVAPIV